MVDLQGVAGIPPKLKSNSAHHLQHQPPIHSGALTIEAPLHDNQRQRRAAPAEPNKKKKGKGGKDADATPAPSTEGAAAAASADGELAAVEGIDAEAWEGAKVVRIARIQLEQDSGKSAHERASTLVDLNRAGSALMEIVFEPDLSSPAQAAELLRTLQATLRHLGTCDGNFEQGSIRCDLNVSVRPAGSPAWGARAEIKNMNSLKALQQAAAYEIRRQIAALERGEALSGETRAFNVATGATRRMRAKEGAVDYRFFPEPDLPPLVLDDALVEAIKGSLPELPQATRRRLSEAPYELSPYQAAVLVGQRGAVAFFEAVVGGGRREAKHVANWVCNDLFGLLKARQQQQQQPGGAPDEEAALLEDCPVTAEALGKLLDLLAEERISARTAKEVLALMVEDAEARGLGPAGIVEAKGWRQVGDEATLKALAERLVAVPGSARQRRQYREGRTNMLKYFVGQAMKETGGRAHPEKVEALLKAALEAWEGGG